MINCDDDHALIIAMGTWL